MVFCFGVVGMVSVICAFQNQFYMIANFIGNNLKSINFPLYGRNIEIKSGNQHHLKYKKNHYLKKNGLLFWCCWYGVGYLCPLKPISFDSKFYWQ